MHIFSLSSPLLPTSFFLLIFCRFFFFGLGSACHQKHAEEEEERQFWFMASDSRSFFFSLQTRLQMSLFVVLLDFWFLWALQGSQVETLKQSKRTYLPSEVLFRRWKMSSFQWLLWWSFCRYKNHFKYLLLWAVASWKTNSFEFVAA